MEGNMSENTSKEQIILEMRHIEKVFPGVRALGDANLTVRCGEVHSLVGENGAGKSTLMNCLLGSLVPNAGEIIYKGQPVRFSSPHEALTAGISMIHQEISLVQSTSVAENVWLGRESTFAQFGLISNRKKLQATQELLDRLNINIRPTTQVGKLSTANMQLIEIARAVSYNADIVIMDEPTSSLSDKEIRILFGIIEDLKKAGTAVIFISHKLDEVLSISDHITVMRDGTFIKEMTPAETDQEDLIRHIAGREISQMYPKLEAEIGDTALEVRGLTRRGVFENVNFSVRRGEILGFFGLVGAGRTEVMRGIFGIDRIDGGEVLLDGKPIKITSPKDAIRQGIGMVTEDRRRSGIIAKMSVGRNITVANLKEISNGLKILDRAKEERDAQEYAEKLAVKTPSLKQSIATLSGGNQQKTILAKWLYTKPRVLILDEPTRGIDVGSKSEIHRMISELAQQGLAVIMISSEASEAMGVADRVIVMSRGHISGEYLRSEFDQEKIIRSAFDLPKEAAAQKNTQEGQ